MSKQNGMTLKKSVMINAMGKYSSVIFQIIFSAILSRILTPAEFGVVTVINVFVVFFELFSDLGIGTAVIQNKNLDDDDVRGIFSFTCLLGIVLSLLFVICSFLIASFYKNDVYIPLGILFSVSIMLTSVNVVPNAVLMKDKKFIAVSIRTVVSCIVGYGVAILLAYMGFSYYALVIRSIITMAFLLVWNLVFSKGVFRFTTNINSIKKIWNYSTYQFGASFLNYFQRNLDNILVGKFMGEETLGYYNKSYTLMQYPVSYLSQAITPVLHPIFADFQDKKNEIFKQYIRVVQILALIGVWVAGIFIACSDEIIYVMFGQQWFLAGAPLRIISFCIWPQMLSGTVGCVMQSIGETKGLFKMCCYTIIVSVTGVTMGVIGGTIVNLAYCIVAIYWIHFIIGTYTLIRQGMGGVLKKKENSLWTELIMLIVMYMIAYFTFKVITFENMFVGLVVKSIVVTIAYVTMLICSGRYKLIWKLIRK